MYQILFRSHALRALKKFSEPTQKILIDALECCAQDPFSLEDLKKLKGEVPHAYRLRVQRHRILLLLITKDCIIEVIDIFLKKSKNDYKERL